MSGQHADGPWEYMPDVDMVVAPASWQDGEGYHMDLRFPRIIATLPDDWDQKHNGLLIAAAPELLEAVQGWQKLHFDMVAAGGDLKRLPRDLIDNFAQIQVNLMRKSDAAIAKAKGTAA